MTVKANANANANPTQQAERENELRRKQEKGTADAPPTSPKPKFMENNKVPLLLHPIITTPRAVQSYFRN